KLVSTGGFDELARIKESDWIIEAVVEQLDVKRSLLERIDAARRPGSIVSSNTSGIPIATLAEGRSADFRKHWLGTHFFNPPRYLHLVELIPTADTASAVLAHVAKNLGFEVPKFVASMIAKGATGEKAGQGFYKRIKSANGSEILTLDPATLEYRPKQSARIASIEAGKAIDDTAERIKSLYNA